MTEAAASAHLARGRNFLRANRPAEAVGEIVLALAVEPTSADAAQLLARLLQQFTLDPAPLVEAALRAALAQDGIDHQPLIRSALNCLMARPAFAALRKRAPSDGWDTAIGAMDLATLAGDALLHDILRRGICHDVGFERFLRALRRRMLTLAEAPPPWWRALAAAIARQSINIEYALPEDPPETAAIAGLVEHLGQGAADDAALLAVLMYRPAPPGLAARDWPAPARDVLAAAQLDPQEAQLRETMPRLSQAGDEASQRVARQYEENPYPRWLTFDPPAPGDRLSALEHYAPGRNFSGAPGVLIAGCGTGRQAIMAAIGYGPAARVTALDLSVASLAYAARMAKRHAVTNITFLQADLRDISALAQAFDIIESVGVLHHIADPLAAWRSLAAHLRPGGVMKIGLYSERARRAIIAARAEIARLGLAADIDGIRAFRRLVIDAPETPKDWRHVLPRFVDFFSASGCRDLVFHEVEHRFSPASLRDALQTLGLEFRGFELSARSMAAFRTWNPAANPLDLAQWEAFEAANPDTFAGMLRFWCTKPAA